MSSFPTSSSPPSLPAKVTTPVVNTLVAKEGVRRRNHMEQLRLLWLRAGSRGLHWRQGTPAEVDRRWQLLMRPCQRLTASALSKHTTAWQRWEEWVFLQVDRSDEVLFNPPVDTVAAFLEFETDRGPTLGRARLQSLGWLRRRLGLDLPVGDALLADFGFYPEGHVAKQAKVISPAMFVNLVGAIHQGGGKVQEEALTLFFALACVRQKHLAISTFVDLSELFFQGYCPEGKARRRGTRPPFTWAVPCPGFVPDVFDFLRDLAVRLKNPPFVIPALTKARMQPLRKWSPEPMQHTMGIRIIRRVFESLGVPGQAVKGLTFNSCRRFLPTMGNLLGLSRHEAQALGNWVEDPTDDREGTSTRTPVMPMAVHYSDQRAIASGLVKSKLLDKFVSLLEGVPQAHAILHGASGTVTEAELSWEILAGLQHEHAKANIETIKEKKEKKDKTAKREKKDRKGSKAHRSPSSPPPTTCIPPSAASSSAPPASRHATKAVKRKSTTHAAELEDFRVPRRTRGLATGNYR